MFTEQTPERTLKKTVTNNRNPVNKINKTKNSNQPKKEIIDAAIIILVTLLISQLLYQVLEITLGIPFPILYVSSPSMTPTINIGDLVIAKNIKPSQIKEGDIIIFKTQRSTVYPYPIIHRVIKKVTIDNTLYLYTKGDNNLIQDPWNPISEKRGDEIIGEPLFIIPKIGYAAMFLQSPIGKAISILYIILSFIYLAGTENLKKFLKPKNKNNKKGTKET